MKLFSRAVNEIMPRISPFMSQKGQDLWVIFKVLPRIRSGFFLELAAADGIKHSNTFALEKWFKWSGICIEPNPFFFEKLKLNRNCILSNSVISDSEGMVKFRIDNKQLGGIVSASTDNNYKVRGDQLENAKIIELESKKLTDLLDENNSPRRINYLSLDVEGSEEAIIGSFDFDKYHFDCLTIERPSPTVNKVLFDNDYVFVKNYRYDTFYVHKENASKVKQEKFQQIPMKDW